MKNNISILILLIAFASINLNAQQQPLFTQYKEYYTFINPAILDLRFIKDSRPFKENLFWGTSYRHQWQLEGAPRNMFTKLDGIIFQDKSFQVSPGVGFLKNETSPLNESSIYVKIGFNLKLKNKDNQTTGGISAGFNLSHSWYQALRENNFNPFHLNDPILNDQDYKRSNSNFGLGLFSYLKVRSVSKDAPGSKNKDIIYLGFSLPQVKQQNVIFENEDNNLGIKPIHHIYGNLGWIITLGDGKYIESSAWLKYVKNTPFSFNVNSRYHYSCLEKDLSGWIGIGYGSDKTIQIETGLNIYKDLFLGFSYDYSFLGLTNKGNAFELNLSHAWRL